MNLENLLEFLQQINSINNLLSDSKTDPNGLNGMIGKQVIVRTYSAGVFFGLLSEKSKNEVILKNARRMYRWWAKESISLSDVAVNGIIEEKSKIVAPVDEIWLEAIEIIPCTEKAIKSISETKNVKPE